MPFSKKRKRPQLLCESLEERALLAVLAGDVNSAFEPNNTIDTAADLGLLGGGLFVTGQTVQVEARIGGFADGAAFALDDVDIYRVDLRAGDRVTFDIDANRLDDGDTLEDPELGNASNSNNILRLFNRETSGLGAYTLLASSTADVAPGDLSTNNTVDPAIVDFVVPATDTYYIGVSGNAAAGNDYNPLVLTGRNTTENTGQYILSVTAVDDDFERPDVDVTGPGANDGDANVVSWEIKDESGLAATTAQVWRNGVIIRPDMPVPLTGSFDLEAFGAGDYRITITATDADNDWLGDHLTNIHSVLFTVADDDTSGPEIDLTPSSRLDGANNQVSWEVTDASGFEVISTDILKNNETLFTGNIPAVGSFDLNSAGIGDFRITINATDGDNDSPGDELSNSNTLAFTIVDDDVLPPNAVVSLPQRNDGLDNLAIWEVSDSSGLASIDVVITHNGQTVLDSKVEPIESFDLNSFGIGDYVVSVTALDDDNDWVGDQLQTVTTTDVIAITDDDTLAPTITFEAPIGNDGSNNVLAWSVSDVSGLSAVSAKISRGDQVIFDTDVDAQGSFDLNSFGTGTYTVEVTATDDDNDWVGDQLSRTESTTFAITDDDSVPPAITIVEPSGSDAEANVVSWVIVDESGFSAINAKISKGDDVIFDSDVTSQSSFDLNSFGVGDFSITIAATDADDDWVGDSLSGSESMTFSITDDDVVAPAIAITVPDEVDRTSNVVGWSVVDVSGLEVVEVMVTKNGVSIYNSDVPGESSLDLDSEGPGDYEITVSAIDADNDWAGDKLDSTSSATFTITDDDTVAPTITINVPDDSDGSNNVVSWEILDASGLDSVAATITRNGLIIADGPIQPSGDFDLNSFGLGTYQINVSATDADNDWVGDELTSTATAEFTVVDDDENSPSIVIASEDQTDGEDNEVSWVAADPSGIQRATVQITRNNVPIVDRPVEGTDSIALNTFGPGVYTVVVLATDADNDWDGDSRTSFEDAAFTIVDDDIDAPEISITSGDANDGANNVVAWNVTDMSGLAALTATISRNGVTITTGDVNPDGSLDINPLGVGNYRVVVNATDADEDWDADQLANTATAEFFVSDDDTEGPTIEINNGSEDNNNVLSWNVSDPSGLARVVATITKNGDEVFSDPVDAIGSVDLNEFGLGEYRVSIEALDADEDWVGDRTTNIVASDFTVADDDTEVPQISIIEPSNNDGLNNILSWTVTDDSELASVTAKISRDGQVIFNSDVDPVSSFDLNLLGWGDYEVTVNATDGDDDRPEDQLATSKTVEFTIADDDDAAPQITFQAPNSSDGAENLISWVVADESGISVIEATIMKGTEVLFGGEIDPIGSFNINSFGEGTYSVSIEATDADEDWVGDLKTDLQSMEFTVVDDDTTVPTIEVIKPIDTDRSDNIVSWSVTDVSGIDKVDVTITKGAETLFDSDVQGQTRFDLDSAGPGDYAITISATDGDRDSVGDQLSTTVTENFSIADDDLDAPAISIAVPDSGDGSDNTVKWEINDASGLASATARITKDGDVLLAAPVSDIGEFDVNTFGLGSYAIEISAVDADNDWVGDGLSSSASVEFAVEDDDDASPTIVVTADDQNDDGSNVVSWVASDVSGVSRVTAEVTRNSISIIEGPVEAIDSINLDSFGPGEYVVTIMATDADNDWSGDSRSSIQPQAFTIVDDDTDPPVVTLTTRDVDDGADNVVAWNVTDASGLASVTATLTRNGVTITEGAVDPAGSVNINQLGIGNYQLRVVAVDADNDWASDQLSTNAVSAFTITDDDVVAPVVNIVQPSGFDGANNVVSWDITDPSGLNEININVFKDGQVLLAGPIEGAGSLDLNEFGLGDYRVSIDALDADADWVGDRLKQITTAEFTIADDDTAAPVISITPETGTIQGDTLSSAFSWTVNDDGSGLGSGFVRVERQLADGTFQQLEQNALTINETQRTVSGETSLEGYGLGRFRLTVGATDADADRAGDSLSVQASSILEVVDAIAPKVVTSSGETSDDFDRLGQVSFTFDEDVSQSLDPTDVELRNLSTDEVFAIEQDFIWDPNSLTASLDLSAITDLNKGLYAVVLKSEGISDAANNNLDGDGDGTAGGEYVAGTFPITWKGDATLNADVEFEDFLIVSNNFATNVEAWGEGDFDGNGLVEFQDFLWVAWNWDQVPTPRA